MRYDVSVADRRLRVEVAPDGRFLVDDAVIALEAVEITPGAQWSITLDGHSHEVTVLGRAPRRLLVDGVAVDVELSDERALAAARASGAPRSHRREIRAPMAGLLKALHVAAGDVVEAGAALATLEAMKMENELRAPSRARISSVAVAAGTKVEGGALLMVLGEVE